MWTATKYGFFSTVRLITDDEETEFVMIRARRREHLERLKERLPKKIGEAEILRQPSSDYLFRVIAPLASWASMSAHLAAEIDYPNFKNEASAEFGFDDEYLSALHRVWSVFQAMEPARTLSQMDLLEYFPGPTESRGGNRGDH